MNDTKRPYSIPSPVRLCDDYDPQTGLCSHGRAQRETFALPDSVGRSENEDRAMLESLCTVGELMELWGK